MRGKARSDQELIEAAAVATSVEISESLCSPMLDLTIRAPAIESCPARHRRAGSAYGRILRLLTRPDPSSAPPRVRTRTSSEAPEYVWLRDPQTCRLPASVLRASCCMAEKISPQLGRRVPAGFQPRSCAGVQQYGDRVQLYTSAHAPQVLINRVWLRNGEEVMLAPEVAEDSHAVPRPARHSVWGTPSLGQCFC